jgi:hypothetical protein
MERALDSYRTTNLRVLAFGSFLHNPVAHSCGARVLNPALQNSAKLARGAAPGNVTAIPRQVAGPCLRSCSCA